MKSNYLYLLSPAKIKTLPVSSSSRIMKITIDLPDDLAQHLNDYLKKHPEETFFSLVKETLEIKLLPKDTSQLLSLAGIVTQAPYNAIEHAEDLEV